MRRTVLAFSAFFLVLCSWYILRPVREEMGVQTGANRLQWLFTGTFIATVLVFPIFGWVVRHVPRRYVLVSVYAFFILNLAFFGFALSGKPSVAMAAAFFIWLSVFNLLIVSLFWSNASDVFSEDDAKRFYGYIAAGGTAGALTGPAIATLLATRVPTSTLIIISAVLLAGSAACSVALRGNAASDRLHTIGGNIFSGATLTVKSPVLSRIALLIIFYTTVSTVLYIEQADIVGKTITDSGERTAFFAAVDLTVNCLALLVQIILTRRLLERYGLTVTFVIAPLLVVVGLFLVDEWRTPLILAAVQIIHRGGDFSLMRPGREMIYTTVDPESRYKAKNFIDTTVYRANDAGSSWLVAAIRSAGLNAILFVGVPAALLWLATAFNLGKRHGKHQPA